MFSVAALRWVFKVIIVFLFLLPVICNTIPGSNVFVFDFWKTYWSFIWVLGVSHFAVPVVSACFDTKVFFVYDLCLFGLLYWNTADWLDLSIVNLFATSFFWLPQLCWWVWTWDILLTIFSACVEISGSSNLHHDVIVALWQQLLLITASYYHPVVCFLDQARTSSLAALRARVVWNLASNAILSCRHDYLVLAPFSSITASPMLKSLPFHYFLLFLEPLLVFIWVVWLRQSVRKV